MKKHFESFPSKRRNRSVFSAIQLVTLQFVFALLMAVAPMLAIVVTAEEPPTGGGESGGSNVVTNSVRIGSNKGSHLGSRLNEHVAAFKFIAQKNGIGGDILDGPFGGEIDVPFSQQEKDTICAVKYRLGLNPPLGIDEIMATIMGIQLKRPATMILAALRTPDLCTAFISARRTPQLVVKERQTYTLYTRSGIPFSFTNATWNQCIQSPTYIPLDIIKINPDKVQADSRGKIFRPKTCGDYYDAVSGIYTYPDAPITFHYSSKGKPTIYVINDYSSNKNVRVAEAQSLAKKSSIGILKYRYALEFSTIAQ